MLYIVSYYGQNFFKRKILLREAKLSLSNNLFKRFYIKADIF